MGSFGLHALKATTGTAKKAAAATVFSMRKSLAGDRDYDARRLLGQLGDPRLDGRLEQFAHLVGGLALARCVTEEHGGGREVRQAQVAGLGDVPAGFPQPVGGVLSSALGRRDVVDPYIGLRRRRGRGRRRWARGGDGGGGNRRLVVVRVARAHRLEP